MPNWKTKLTIVAVPAVLAVAGTAVIAQAAGPPSATPTASAGTATGTSTEAPETATEQVEANEPNLPGGGHTDSVGQADHQFEGVE
ncbi:MAG: hypothetical protein DLM66_10015 [Candidatus Dormiibacter spiritus]|nr:MAG: hypothetical protein DLM66_10015 [Candidatus Dormibacteraeota bacterium]